ncbi:MAG: hypothetical protein JW910_14170 [Anaerolineae bacterium]|nr:hypothetical protein [Anaerolineae bacterium]
MKSQRSFETLRWIIAVQIGVFVFAIAVVSISYLALTHEVRGDAVGTVLSAIATTPPTAAVESAEQGLLDTIFPAIAAVGAMLLVGKPLGRMFGYQAPTARGRK